MQVFSKERCENRWNHRGMTVIEVLIVIVLMAVVLAPAVNALSATTKIWSHNSAINPCIAQANASMSWIGREIRSAAQPSSTVDSVLVEDGGQRIIIYRYNETDAEWEKVFYQINGDNQLKKIIISESDPADIITAAIPGESDSGWTTLLEGVTSSPVFNRPANSRAVEVNLQVSDSGQTNERFAPFNLVSTYMIRNREVGSITGAPVPETEPPGIPAHKVVVNPDSTTLKIWSPWKKHDQIISATIWPANATDKSVTWTSSNEDWVLVEYDPANSLTAKIVLNKESGALPWPPPTVTAKPNGGGDSDTCTVYVIY